MEARNVNIYFVPNDKNQNGGRFYNVYINREEKLDLSPFLDSIANIDELSDIVKEQDETFKKAGGVIVKKDETIGSATIYTPDNGGINLDKEQQASYEKWIELDRQSSILYEQRKKDMEEFIAIQRSIDDKLAQIEQEKSNLSEKIKESFVKVKRYE